VKAFGKQMVADHTKAGEELKQIAAQHNIQAPADLDDTHRDQIERLTKLQGAEFDREYIQQMVDNHEKTLEALEDRVDTEGTDENPTYTAKRDDNQVNAAINGWAAKTAPVVHQHLQKARQLNEKVGRRMTNE
jgi:putative membrane protein